MIPRARASYRTVYTRQKSSTIPGGSRTVRWHYLHYPRPTKKWSAVAALFRLLSLDQITFVDCGVIVRSHDPTDYSGNPSHFFEAILRSTVGGVNAYARLFNVSDNAPVAGSVVATPSTTATRRRSPAFSLPTSAKEYRAEFGS